MDMSSSHVFAFDFDGVLAIPYSQPEVLFAGTERLLRDLAAAGHPVIVTSFNPRAYHVLRPLLEEGVIRAIRAGSCIKWWLPAAGGGAGYVDALHRRDMQKSLHLRSMLADELAGVEVKHVLFVDDDLGNIAEVAVALFTGAAPALTTCHVPWYMGFGTATLRAYQCKSKHLFCYACTRRTHSFSSPHGHPATTRRVPHDSLAPCRPCRRFQRGHAARSRRVLSGLARALLAPLCEP